jgi:hypothetical protein
MSSTSDAVLKEILEGLRAMRTENAHLAASVDKINGRVNMLAGIKQIKDEAASEAANGTPSEDKAKEAESSKAVEAVSQQYEEPPAIVDAPPRRASVSKTSKIILTSYPGQAGVDPLPMEWGAKDPAVRGPVVVSRHANTIRRRNGKFIRVSMLFCVIPDITQPLVPTEARTPSTMLLQLQARTSTSPTNQISRTPNLLQRLVLSRRGATKRRLWLWIRTVILLHGCSRKLWIRMMSRSGQQLPSPAHI